jgi:hypothetical protein
MTSEEARFRKRALHRGEQVPLILFRCSWRGAYEILTEISGFPEGQFRSIALL